MKQNFTSSGVVLLLLMAFSVKSQNIYKIWDNTIQAESLDGRSLQITKLTEQLLCMSSLCNSDSGYDKTASNINHTTLLWNMLISANGTPVNDFHNYGRVPNDLIVLDSGSCAVLAWGGNPGTPNSYNVVSLGSQIITFNTSGSLQWDGSFNAGYDSLDRQNHGDVLPFAAAKVNNSIYIVATASVFPLYTGGDLTAVNCSGYSDFNKDILFYKTNINDSVSNQWHQLYGGDSVEFASSLLTLANGDFLIGGVTSSSQSCNQTTGSYNRPYYDFYVVRVDSTGNIIWQNKYGGDKNDWLSGILDMGNDEYILYGHTNSVNSYDITAPGWNDTSLWLVKIDAMGNILWNKRYGSCNSFTPWAMNIGAFLLINEFQMETVDAIKTSDGGILIVSNVNNDLPCGDVTEGSRGYEDYWALKLDAAGNIQWDKRLGGPGRDFAEQVIEMSPGYYIIGGVTTIFNPPNSSAAAPGGDRSESIIGNSDIWLVGLADSTVIQSLPQQSQFTFNLYPNPAQDIITVEMKTTSLHSTFQIFDITGNCLITHSITSDKSRINITGLPAAVYIISVQDQSGNKAVQKLVKL